MNISIIMPVYNGESTIKQSLFAIVKQMDSNDELIVVNDCSKDKTKEISEKIIHSNPNLDIRIVDNEENMGRALTREIGAKEAINNNLLFIDVRSILQIGSIKELKKLKENVVYGNTLVEIYNIFSRFNHLIRLKIYKNKYGKEEFDPYYITKSNFENEPKGTTLLFCKKNIFLSSQPDNKESKNNSDDIKLFKNIVEKAKILRHPKVYIKYITRDSLFEFIKHTYQRGPKFVDYYLNKNTRFFKHLIFFYFCLFIIILLLIFDYRIIFYILSAFLILVTFVSIWLMKNIKDFGISLICFPIVFISFALGVINGLFLKMLKLN